MKKFTWTTASWMLAILGAMLIYSYTFKGNTFCDGYKKGYKKGNCFEIEFCIEPTITPLCPLPKLGATTYEDGYSRGFLDGYNAQ